MSSSSPRSTVHGDHLKKYDPQTRAKDFAQELSPGMRAEAVPGGTVRNRIIGLLLGPALGLLLFILMPADIGVWPRLIAGTAVLMAIWWMTEAIPIPATSLLPLVLFPVFVPAAETPEGEGVSVSAVGASYGADTIFLFMGGFMLALAMQRWNLHRRIALSVLATMGSKTANLIAGFMIATGFLSMWVSNTATAVMMLPIGISVLMLVQRYATGAEAEAVEADLSDEELEQDPAEMDDQQLQKLTKSNFGTALMLGIAYAASIGSLGTLIGTPPNTLLAGFMRETHGVNIGFAQWMLVGMPVAILLMVACWFVLTKLLFRPEIDQIEGGQDLIREEKAKLGPMSSGERRVLALFVLAALAWVAVPLVSEYLLGLDSAPIADAGIAIAVGILLFLLPAGGDAQRGVRLLDWESAIQLPWGVLLLFGGGLALSKQFGDSGLSEWIGEQVAGLGGIPVIVLVAVAAVGILLLTEMTSNTATAATFLPVASGVAMGTGIDPLMLCAPVALAATCAFMLPVATPPNAIAFGSGYVTVGQMVKGGVWINLIATVLIIAASMTLLVWVFGLTY
ncbi:DASS family sodium-coupled anion symporter [Micrococcus lylae]|uniref:SLC13 family permease n=1 Tax=Micrococcus lylae TaxID=1273 RepID=UPI0021A96081|nr:DASS family sodium-coupled anion symporter [Micrococcus lylae]MCT2006725.1 DASS family sodium-coupled anion symporter [Micrococcus lylae]MCT2070607.1 DASS family sodium-coupled anion symporter [Micrococcus lylae]